ncbi:MAG: 3'-5' exonuclease [Gammaproteobacteria bacterium]|nr:3'-5' exonuclease [Gammaproteobacteria bacterium]
MNVLAFDLATIPDSLAGRRLHGLGGLSDGEVAKVLFAKHSRKTGGSDFLPPHLHKVVAISGVLCTGDELKVWSMGDQNAKEKELITRFCQVLDEHSPTLVSWNGGEFDLPVLHYRSLLHRVHAHRYWNSGEEGGEMKRGPGSSRCGGRQIDLMDALSGLNASAAVPLDEIAGLLGFPGKPGRSGITVWEAYRKGGLPVIRNNGETAALKTFLVYLRWELVRGNLSELGYDREMDRTRAFLENSGLPHFLEFLQAWNR